MNSEPTQTELKPRRHPPGDWLDSKTLAAMTPADLVARARALTPLAAENAALAEELRRPVDDVWNAIRASGVFYHFVPKRFGGLEFDVETFIDAMLPIAEGCASTGWVTSFCVEHNWMLAQFPEQAQAEIFADYPYIIAPGVTQPPGRAERVAGGYRLSGRWKWGTGVMHADWVLATGIDPDKAGPPQVLFFAVPVEEVRILDTWYMDGMVGTGSHDIAATNVFVPEHRMLDFADMRAGCAPGSKIHDNPIYRMAMLPFLALTAAIPAVGVARATVARFRDRLSERVLLGTEGKQVEKPAAQMRLARADIQARTAELLIRDAGRRNVEMAASGQGISVADRIALRAQIAEAMDMCRACIRTVSEGAGSSAHQLSNPIQRALRDITVMSSHVVYDLDIVTELHGRALVGLPPNSVLV